MDRLLSTTRPAISWLLLSTLCGPSFAAPPAAAGRVAKLPAAFSLSAATQPLPAEQPQPGTAKDSPTPGALHIVVISGDKGVNILKKKIAVRPVVQVLDESDRPVSGALVTFTAPSSGPSVQFAQGTRTAMIVSDSGGRVAPTDITPVNAGSFVYRIRAIYQEQEATETLAQTNVPNGSATSDPAQTGQTPNAGAARDHRIPNWAIAALIGGAAAAVGIGVALGTRQSSKTAAATPAATIGAPGSVTVGAP